MLTYFHFRIQSNFNKNKFETSNVKNIFQGLPWISIHLQTFIFLYAKISLTFIRQQQQLICAKKFQTTALHSIIFYGCMHLRILLGKHIFFMKLPKKIIFGTFYRFHNLKINFGSSRFRNFWWTDLHSKGQLCYFLFDLSALHRIQFLIYLVSQVNFQSPSFLKKKHMWNKYHAPNPKSVNGSKLYLEVLVKTLNKVFFLLAINSLVFKV